MTTVLLIHNVLYSKKYIPNDTYKVNGHRIRERGDLYSREASITVNGV